MLDSFFAIIPGMAGWPEIVLILVLVLILFGPKRLPEIADAMGNLIGSASGGGIIDPMLGSLAINGGTTRTHMPLGGSPVIDAGDDALAVDANAIPLMTDQRDARSTAV